MTGEMKKELYVSIDADRCCGAGHCVRIAPQVFDQDELDGTVVLLQAYPSRAMESALDECVAVCPTGAIAIENIPTSIE